MLVSFVGALAVVLALLLVTLRLLKRLGGASSNGGLDLRVVQRLPLSQRQGIAVVSLEGRLLAVSVGEGGVRLITEIEKAGALETPDEVDRVGAGVLRLPVGVSPAGERAVEGARALWKAAAARAGLVVALAMVAAAAALPMDAVAQAAPAPGEALQQLESAVNAISPQMDLQVGEDGEEGLRLSGTVGVVVMMGLLTLLPTLLLMMTSFTRILIVLHFLRQALGTQSAPPGHLMAALALLLTGFVMAPTLAEANGTALQPWLAGEMEQAEMMATAVVPFRDFMLANTRDADLLTFLEMSGSGPVETASDLPLVVLTSAFVVSELKTAFQIGFALFLPFIVIDMVVASVLMSMGMFMLPPAMIALPFKLLLFVLADGWSLVVQSVVASFR